MNDIPEELQERMAAYIDGQLSPSEAARFEVFLANTDPKLADRLVGMLADKHAVSHMPRPAAPRDLAAHIMEQIERTSLLHNVEEISAPHRRWHPSRVAIAAGIAIVIGGFTYFVVYSVQDSPNKEYRERLTSVGSMAKTPEPARMRDASKSGDGAVMSKGGALGGQQLASADESRQSNKFDSVAAPLPAPTLDTQIAARRSDTDSGTGHDIADSQKAPETRQLAAANIPGPAGLSEIAPMPQGTPMDANAAPAGAIDNPAGGGFGGGGGAGGGGGFGGAGRGARGGMASASGGAGGGRGGRRGGGGGGAFGGRALAQQQIDTPQKALSLVARESTAQPIVLTVIARDEQDAGKLLSSLRTINLANGHSSSSLRVGGNSIALNTSNYSKDGGTPNAGNYDNGGQRQSNNDLLNGNQMYRDQGLEQQARAGNISGNNFAGGVNGNITNQQQAVQQAYGNYGNGPFRLLINSTQLAELASSFNIALVARGNDTYQFHAAGAPAPASADPQYRAEVLRRVGINEFATTPATLPAVDAITGVAAEKATPAAIAPASLPTTEQKALTQGSPAPDAPVTIPAAAAAPAAPLLDCVIIVEPAVAVPPATAPDAGLPH